MIKLARIVLGGDKPYQDVQMMLPGEMDTTEVSNVLGEDKAVVFNTPGAAGMRRTPKWVFTHAQNISLIIIDNLVRRTSNSGSGLPFERIVLGNASYAAGHIVAEQDFEGVGVPKELLDAKIFDKPVVFVVQEGLCITNAATIASLECAIGAPKAKQQDIPPATNAPLKIRNPDDIRGPSLEQIDRANAAKQALHDQHGGPLRGTSHGGAETFSEVGTDPYGNPVSRDITRPALQDQGPGREGGSINPPREFDATKVGDIAGHGKNFGQPEGIRGQSAGSVGADADRAANVGEFNPPPAREALPSTNTPQQAAAVHPSPAKPDVTKAETKPVAAPAPKAEEKKAVKAPEVKQEVAKPKEEVIQGTKDVKSTEATKPVDAGAKPPTGSEADKAAQTNPTPSPTPIPTPDPVKVDPAPGQKIEEVKDKK